MRRSTVFLLCLQVVLAGCLPLQRHRPSPLVDLGPDRDIQADYDRLRKSVGVEQRNISASDGKAYCAFDQLAQVYDLGDCYARVYPHNFTRDTFMFNLVAGRLAPGRPLSSLLPHHFEKATFDLVKDDKALRSVAQRRVGFYGIVCLGDTVQGAMDRYVQKLAQLKVPKDQQSQYLANARDVDGVRLLSFEDDQIALYAPDGVIVALSWFSKPPPTDGFYRHHPKAGPFPVLVEGAVSDR